MNISWYDKDFYNDEKEVLKDAKEKSQYCWDEPLQMFLLGEIRENINFEKDSKGGMFGSKIYFKFDDKVKNINDLEVAIKNKKWSEFKN